MQYVLLKNGIIKFHISKQKLWKYRVSNENWYKPRDVRVTINANFLEHPLHIKIVWNVDAIFIAMFHKNQKGWLSAKNIYFHLIQYWCHPFYLTFITLNHSRVTNQFSIIENNLRMDFAACIENVGSFGLYQKLLSFVFVSYTTFSCGANYYTQVKICFLNWLQRRKRFFYYFSSMGSEKN